MSLMSLAQSLETPRFSRLWMDGSVQVNQESGKWDSKLSGGNWASVIRVVVILKSVSGMIDNWRNYKPENHVC